MTKTVLLADFQFLTRRGIRSLIDDLDDFKLIGTVDSSEDLESMVHIRQPDLLVLDISQNEPGTIETLRNLCDAMSPAILIISNNQNRIAVQSLLDMGIKGIVTKNCSEEEITNAMRSVIEGNRFFCNKVLDLVAANENAEDNCDPTSLTQREFEVILLITKGLKTNQIADQLHVSPHTINSHRKNILKKLNLTSPVELIVYALESGLVGSNYLLGELSTKSHKLHF